MEQKIQEVIKLNKAKLITNGDIDNFIYLVDTNDALHVIPVEDKRYLSDPDYVEIFRGVIKSVISDYKRDGVMIKHLFYLKEAYFSSSYKNLQDLDMDSTFSKYNANECLMVYSEDKFNMKIAIYDMIISNIDGSKYTVLSENPIKELDYCKLDPDDNLKGALTNIIR